MRELIEILGLSGCFAALIFLPEVTSSGVIEGLRLCGTAILPALFPFFICTNLIGKLGLSRKLSEVLRPLTRRLFGCDAAAPLVLGLLGGYPAGAKAAAGLYQSGELDRDSAVCLLRFCNNSGPAFIFGVMGSRVFGSVRTGLLLYAVHLLSALLCGLLTKPAHAIVQKSPPPKKLPFASAFTESVRDAGASAFQVCLFVTVFSAISALFRLLPIPEPLRPLLIGMLELSGGANALAAAALPDGVKLITASFLLAFGGISIHAQTKALLLDAGLPDAPVLLPKLLHALLAALLTAACLTPAGIFLPVGIFSLFFLKVMAGNLRTKRI